MAKKTAPKPEPATPAEPAQALNPLVAKLAELLLQFILGWLARAQSTPRSSSIRGDRAFLMERRVLKVQGGRSVGYSTTAITLADRAAMPVLYLVNPSIYRTMPAPTFPRNNQVQVLPLSVVADQDEVDDLDPSGLVVVDAAGLDVNTAAIVDATASWLKAYPKLAYVVVG